MQQLYLQLSNGQFLRQLYQQLSNKMFLDSTTTKCYTEHSYGGSDVADSERVRKHLNGVNIDSFSNGKNRSELIIWFLSIICFINNIRYTLFWLLLQYKVCDSGQYFDFWPWPLFDLTFTSKVFSVKLLAILEWSARSYANQNLYVYVLPRKKCFCV